MATFIQCRIYTPLDKTRDHDPLYIACAAITAIEPIWNESEEWTHTIVHVGARGFLVRHLASDIADAIAAPEDWVEVAAD
jgi:hypothetical protein